MHGENYMTQRTFNQINACTSDEQHPEDMECEPVSKSKRGRKRQSDEDCLSEAERIKKEKNRKAAQKCREKKDKEAKELKNRNEELEAENKKLSEDKSKLEERAHEYYQIIKAHTEKGCTLPTDVQELYNEEAKMISSFENVDEAFRAVGTIERDHTPPHTPEGSSHGKLSPNPQQPFHNIHGNTFSPTALFSGTPLNNHVMNRGRSVSSSRSSSSSPALSMSPANADVSLARQQNNLAYSMKSNQITISHASQHDDKDQFTHSVQTLPTVVSEIDENSENTSECTSQPFEMFGREGKVMRTDLQPSNNWSLGNVTKQSSRESHNQMDEESGQNLCSLGFSCVQGYSYTKDLQRKESVQEIIEYTNDESEEQNLSSEMKNTSGSSSGHPDSQLVVDINVGAPALLDMGTEMAESLQQQIKTSYSNPFGCVPAIMSASGGSQQHVLRQQVAAYHVQGIHFKPDLVQQQLNILKQQQQTAHKQALKNNLETLKEEQSQAGQSSNMYLIKGPVQAIMKSGFVSKIDSCVQNKHSPKMQETSQPGQCKKPQHLQRQFSDQSLPCGPQSSRGSLGQQKQQHYAGNQSSQELPFQQIGQQKITLGPSANKFVSSQVHLSKNNSSIVSAETLGFTSSNISVQFSSGLQPSSSLNYCSPIASLDSYGLQLTSQQTQGTKLPPSNRYFINTQVVDEFTQLLPSSSTAQALTVDSSPNAQENIDYGANLKDLPSLNFQELQSDNNLFEKKPSRLTF